ncbi:MAG: hypothetical protein ABIN80_26210 [Dyadobacter sp.]|uniref:hypothetical protein n=1 Tax=Dyadobacter sp. TaxID=1914288 RepID=UPI003266A1ED
MPQITNKIKLSGLFAGVLVASALFISCGKDKQSDDTETTAVDSTDQVIEKKMVPDSIPGDSLPALDDSSSTRPEPRKTR